MIEIKNKKIACISDIHLGVHRDSQVWHDIAIEFATWLKDTLHKKNITDIIIAGDVFHNRHEIGVSTIHVANAFFNILKDFNIIVTIGNHDCFYRDKPDINSVSILNRDNIKVLEELYVHTAYGKKIVFCPWGYDVNNIPECDIIFGHFEIKNFKMNYVHVCEHGSDTGILLGKAKHTISGHFHFREHRKYPDNKSILYLGSPYELDFGDRDQVKGVTLLDLDTLDFEFIENNITPKHKRIKLSSLLDENVTPEHFHSLINNNFVCLYVDRETKPKVIDTLISKFSQYKPKHIKAEFDIFKTVQLSASELNEISIDIDTALHEFVNLLDTPVPKNNILNKCLELYKLSQTLNEN